MRPALHYANKGRLKIALSSVTVRFENADDTKQIADDTKQNCGMKTYGICGSPGSQFCKSGIGILQKGEVIP
ncbi:hypothetical protein T4D_12408 [Trichinella pseudospiralis]|uniref:Uncharacterized protein n=1 Tax=Trichinella pseudospiralis TaxID=6337 RepID=A0A0V1FNH5_TRIPS|nr:hypothetical protein T4D_12408 [Trichinella pseudospiralis]